MNFIVRPACSEDLSHLEGLARQFTLLNLPPNKKIISEKIELSEASFAGKESQENSKYLFVVEDQESGWVVGCSQINTQHGSAKNPTYSFQISKKEMFSKDLGVGFIHQVLKLKITTDGPTELGGLVVSRAYRSRPEKVGKLISLSRFVFIGMQPDRFKENLHSEMAPPLTDDGRSEFWEALGRRFTGMPYPEADKLSLQNKEFIESLFPKEEIYLALLDPGARLVLGRVSEQTAGALHLLKKIGFKEKNEVDPFDGGPHLGCKKSDVSLIQSGQTLKLKRREGTNNNFDRFGYIGFGENMDVRIFQSQFMVENEHIILPKLIIDKLKLSEGQSLYLVGGV